MAFLAHDDVVMHRDAQGLGDLDDRLRHLDVGAGRRRVAGGVIVNELTHCPRALKSEVFSVVAGELGAATGGGSKCSLVIIPSVHAHAH